jgi:hypothetical protein
MMDVGYKKEAEDIKLPHTVSNPNDFCGDFDTGEFETRVGTSPSRSNEPSCGTCCTALGEEEAGRQNIHTCNMSYYQNL